VTTINAITIEGARQHNLKNISLRLPRNQLVVITGLSGSGKSTLAFDTLYAEGQRRYVESLSTYARQFSGAAGKARCGSDRGPLSGHRHRAENRHPQPPFDGGHGHRNL
jgi:excinuclease ABC subunit A